MTTISSQMAKHLRDVVFGGNWSISNYQQVIRSIPVAWIHRSLQGSNSILTLFCHATYYIGVQLEVTKGNPLVAKDEWSFKTPEINTQEEWMQLLQEKMAQTEELASLLETLPDEQWQAIFVQEKYGTWFRNFAGCIEHLHYHLGQIALIATIIKREQEQAD